MYAVRYLTLFLLWIVLHFIYLFIIIIIIIKDMQFGDDVIADKCQQHSLGKIYSTNIEASIKWKWFEILLSL